MDVVLVSKDRNTLLFIESKFGEHFSPTSAGLHTMANNESYNTDSCYYDRGDDWINLISKYDNAARLNARQSYYDGIKQEICHLLGLTNLKAKRTIEWFNSKDPKSGEYRSWLTKKGIILTGDEEFRFYNVVFIPASNFADSCIARNYLSLYRTFRDDVKNSGLSNNILMDIRTYSELWNSLSSSIPEQIRDYLLNRYMILSDLEE